MRILVLGASGMLGSAAFRGLTDAPGVEAFATARGDGVRRYFAARLQASLITGVDVLDTDAILDVLDRVRPDVVLNCVGVVKHTYCVFRGATGNYTEAMTPDADDLYGHSDWPASIELMCAWEGKS